jgi:hypothetical protein
MIRCLNEARKVCMRKPGEQDVTIVNHMHQNKILLMAVPGVTKLVY